MPCGASERRAPFASSLICDGLLLYTCGAASSLASDGSSVKSGVATEGGSYAANQVSIEIDLLWKGQHTRSTILATRRGYFLNILALTLKHISHIGLLMRMIAR